MNLTNSTSSRLRHVVLHHVFGAIRGGVERDVFAFISSSADHEHIVVVFGDDGPMAEEWRRAGATVEILGSASSGPFAISSFLREAIQRHRPDGMIAWFGLVQLPQIIRVCNQQKVKLVVHAGNPGHTMPRKVELRYLAMSYWWQAAGPLPVYACCSKYVAESFASSRYLRQFPRIVIYNGIELPLLPAHQPRPYDPERPFVIGMTARLSPIKDHDTLLRAFALVAKRFPNVHLELAGDGVLRSQLEGLARELSITDKMTFLGDVADIYKVMSRWDLFAYATTEQEGLGNAVSEAMAMGLPCVITDIGPMREFEGDGTCVQLVTPRNPVSLAKSILEVIPDHVKRRQLGSAARDQSLLRFSPDGFAKEYRKILGLASEGDGP